MEVNANYLYNGCNQQICNNFFLTCQKYFNLALLANKILLFFYLVKRINIHSCTFNPEGTKYQIIILNLTQGIFPEIIC